MAREKGTASAAPGALEFEATLTAVKPVIAAKDQYGYGKAGKLEVTFAIPQPDMPKAVQVPYALQGSGGKGIKERPKPVTEKKKGEADPTFETRKVESESSIRHYDQQMAQWEADKRRYERQAGAYQARLVAYAQLVGLAAVFGNQDLRVVVYPKTSLLAGFGVQLLAAPEEDPEEAIAGALSRGSDILLDDADDEEIYPDDEGGDE